MDAGPCFHYVPYLQFGQLYPFSVCLSMEPPLRSIEVSRAFGPYPSVVLSFHIITCDTVKGCSGVCCWVRCALPTLSMRTRCARLSPVTIAGQFMSWLTLPNFGTHVTYIRSPCFASRVSLGTSNARLTSLGILLWIPKTMRACRCSPRDHPGVEPSSSWQATWQA